MARGILLVCLSIISVPAVLSQSQSTETFQDFNTYYDTIKAFGEPVEGSQAEKSAQDFVAALAQKHGFSVQYNAVQSQGKYHSFSRSLRVSIPGTDSGVIGIEIPVTSVESELKGAYDPSIGPALASVLLDKLSMENRPYSIQIDLLGAENTAVAGLGTQRLIEDPTVSSRLFVLYLAIFSDADNWELTVGAERNISPLWLVDAALKNLEKNGISIESSQVETQLHRTGFGPENHTGPYLRAGIPAVEFRPARISAKQISPQHVEKLESWILDLCVRSPAIELSQGANPQWDSNYLLFNTNFTHSFISERVLVLSLMGGTSITILIMATRRKGLIRYLLLIGKHIGALFFLALLSVGSFLLASLLIRFVTSGDLSGFLRPETALTVAAIKFALGSFLFHSAFQVLKRVLPKHSNFYSAAAIAWSLLALVAVLSINMTLGIYSALALWGIGLGVMVRSPVLKMLFGTLGLAAILWPVEEALRLFPSQNLLDTIVFSYVPGDVLIGLLSFPFALSLRRIIFMIPNRFKPKKKLGWLLSLTVVFCAAGAIIVLGLVFEQKKNNGPQLTMTITGNAESDDAELTISGTDLPKLSGVELRAIQSGMEKRADPIVAAIGFGNRPNAISSDEEKISLNNKRIHLSYGTRSFLGRKSLSIMIQSGEPVDSLDISFAADSPLLVYSINFPYKYDDAKKIKLLIGKNPPMPLRIEMTFPMETSGQLYITTHSKQQTTVQLDDRGAHDIEVPYTMTTSYRWD